MTDATAVGTGHRAGRPVLEVRDLTVAFPSEEGPVQAVRGLSYSVTRGEVLGIVGESGSGKSASSLAVMGLLPGSARATGSVRLNGDELLGRPDRRWKGIRGKSMSMVFQHPSAALTPVFTVGDQIAEAITTHRDLGKAQARRRAVELLDLVGVPEPSKRAGSFPHEFSGGMCQRVMIAMAIANEPDVIIADEPTSSLDVTIQAQILDVFRRVKEVTGAAIVLITHDLGVVAGLADEVLVMYAGKPVETADVHRLFSSPSMPYTIGLLGSMPRLDTARGRPLTGIDGVPPSLVKLPPGCSFALRCPVRTDVCVSVEPKPDPLSARHHVACHRAREIECGALERTALFPSTVVTPSTLSTQSRDSRAVVLELDDVARRFPIRSGAVIRRKVGSVSALDGISFDIREGETLGLVGESGCGKTTTIRQILDLCAPRQGTVSLFGRDVTRLRGSDRLAVRRDLQVVFQDPTASLDPRLPISDIVAEPLRTHRVPAAERDARVRDLLDLVGLDARAYLSRFPAELSGGQRQRVAIARALALAPRLVLLDEPVSALDVSVQASVLNLLQELKTEMGLSYLFVAHDLSVARYIADRIAVMYLGRIVEIGHVDAVFTAPSHPYTQALLSAVPLSDPDAERRRRRVVLTGDHASSADPRTGCRFRSRCPTFAALGEAQRARCIEDDPRLQTVGASGKDHAGACHYPAVLTGTTCPQ